MDVTVLLIEGGMGLTSVGPMDVFGAAGVTWNALGGRKPEPRFRVTTASHDGRAVQPEGPVALRPQCSIAEIRRTDLIFVAALGIDAEAAVRRNRSVPPWLKSWARRGATIAGVCSGVALLAEAGLLDGKPATTHWALADDFRRRYPAVNWRPEYFITEADNVFCSGGVGAALDLSLHLVEKFCGRAVAVECSKALLLEMPRVWQAGYAHLPMKVQYGDEAIRRAQEWIHARFREDFRFEALAGRVAMSPRNFIRRFKDATGETPLSYLQQLRVAAAKRLLEEGRKTIREVSAAVGYDDLTFFRSLFKRHTGLPPNAYRQQFGRNPGA